MSKKTVPPHRFPSSTQLETALRQRAREGDFRIRYLLRGDESTPDNGVLHHVDRYSLLIETQGKVFYVAKHAIDWIAFDDSAFLAEFLNGKKI